MSFKQQVLSWSRLQKNLLAFSSDYLILILSFWMSFSIVKREIYSIGVENFLVILFYPLISAPIFILFGLYRSIIRFINIESLWLILGATSCYSLALYFFLLLLFTSEYVLVISIINFLLVLPFIIFSRLTAARVLSGKSSSSRVIIYGAGSAGSQLVAALSYSPEMKPVALVDNDKKLQGNYLNGLKIYGPERLEELLISKSINEVLIAIPSAPKAVLSRLLKLVENNPVKVRILPGIAELAQGKVSISKLKEVEVEDILGREVINPSTDLMNNNIKGKSVMVTGAGGSIGSELCKEIVKFKPKSLILFELSEFSLYKIENELSSLHSNLNIFPILGNVNDSSRLIEVCNTFKIDTVYHAAAYKHVPLVENNVIEAVKNNIFGTYNCLDSAIKSGVETFVLISSDKAVRPTNVMGATKRFSEMILQSYPVDEHNNSIKICMVRFGNVIGSSGSAIPLFIQQIKYGGPVTVTDPEVVRYFMTVKEAAQLVIQSGTMAKDREVFILDMGEPVKIFELAKKLINLSGMELKNEDNPDGDIEIIFTGLRSGEKLYEELLLDENSTLTKHERIMCSKEKKPEWGHIYNYLEGLNKSIEEGIESDVYNTLIKAVVDFKPKDKISDLLYLNKRG